MNDKIKELLMKRAVGGKISCPAARKIAEELSVPYREISRNADELRIKITGCELGCF